MAVCLKEKMFQLFPGVSSFDRVGDNVAAKFAFDFAKKPVARTEIVDFDEDALEEIA